MKVPEVKKTIKFIDLILMNQRHFDKADINLEIYWRKIERDREERFDQAVREKILLSYFFKPFITLDLPAKLNNLICSIVYPSMSVATEDVEMVFHMLNHHIIKLQ